MRIKSKDIHVVKSIFFVAIKKSFGSYTIPEGSKWKNYKIGCFTSYLKN